MHQPRVPRSDLARLAGAFSASGWIGGGTEIALDARWPAKLDFLYIVVGRSQRVVPNGAVLSNPGDFADRLEVIRAYKLGG
jgi:hypothetical protein